MKTKNLFFGCLNPLSIIKKKNPSSPEVYQPIFTKGISINTTKKQDTVFHRTHGFISDVTGTGEPGVLMHGTKSGVLYFKTDLSSINQTGCSFSRIVLRTPSDLYKCILKTCNIDLKKFEAYKPLHLICCYGNADTSMAQKLADFLNRPVVAYGTGGVISTPGATALMGGKYKVMAKQAGMYIPARKQTYTPHPNKNMIIQNLYIDIPWDYSEFIV